MNALNATDSMPTAIDSDSAGPTGRPKVSRALAINAASICKSYTIGGVARPVLDGIDFQLHERECVFLVGPSGSGKTTLLSILGLLLTPEAGQLQFFGERVDGLPEEKRTLVRRKMIGFVFQRFQLIDGLDAKDNVAIPLTMHGVPISEARKTSAALLERMGLGDHTGALPSSMSPGQCQRVALARAVVAKPKLILADEPTAALDSQSGKAVMDLLRELTNEFNTSTVVVTHDPRIYSYADRVCEMENGRFK
ncbi:ABC transporter ATP-binding protein [Rhodopirellula sp. MGV]|uniref:ABC transporter ATP-binding protein n=1 Tax=Rhodopirellula sp. MGV TaxID=2023130 RepID=UPI000B97909A|nr:ABC transporter ATP-binding protein [Rhodopirellula sp. MGV]OYP33035.1 ABC transporter ATP-binding protein [Rhodopirellula sp. MGV]PNY35302.1 ABC transporter ATP-binding protein [Rhodopirellula baltica]